MSHSSSGFFCFKGENMRLTKQQKETINQYIIDCIDTDPYGVTKESEKGKLKFLYDTFCSEYWTFHKQYHKNNIHEAFKSWMMGLPSCFNVEFRNYDILQIAKKWGSIPVDATEKQEDKTIESWFGFITHKTFQLFTKHGIY